MPHKQVIHAITIILPTENKMYSNFNFQIIGSNLFLLECHILDTTWTRISWYLIPYYNGRLHKNHKVQVNVLYK